MDSLLGRCSFRIYPGGKYPSVRFGITIITCEAYRRLAASYPCPIEESA